LLGTKECVAHFDFDGFYDFGCYHYFKRIQKKINSKIQKKVNSKKETNSKKINPIVEC
jgi:hypothetical protein